jgi:arylsulfatase A-like enzyme
MLHPAQQGHICLIWVDDLIDVYTWRDAFGLRIETPNLDRFMARATRFANAYATVPLCAPCRAELATGISPVPLRAGRSQPVLARCLPARKAWQYDLRRAGFYNFTTGKVDSNYKPMPEDYRRILFHEEPAADDKGKRTRACTPIWTRGRASKA